jgi:hypothetical protein
MNLGILNKSVLLATLLVAGCRDPHGATPQPERSPQRSHLTKARRAVSSLFQLSDESYTYYDKRAAMWYYVWLASDVNNTVTINATEPLTINYVERSKLSPSERGLTFRQGAPVLERIEAEELTEDAKLFPQGLIESEDNGANDER